MYTCIIFYLIIELIEMILDDVFFLWFIANFQFFLALHVSFGYWKDFSKNKSILTLFNIINRKENFKILLNRT